MAMRVRMLMTMVVIVIVIVTVVTVVIVIMIMIMIMMMIIVVMIMARMRARAVGLERRGERRELRRDTGEQRLDLGVAADPHPVGEDLHRHVAIAEPPGHASERRGIRDARFDQRFRVSHDLDQRAVVEHERVIGRKRRRIGEIEFDAGAPAGEEETLLGLALVEIENERIAGGGRTRLAGSQDFRRAWHGSLLAGPVS